MRIRVSFKQRIIIHLAVAVMYSPGCFTQGLYEWSRTSVYV